MSQTLQQIIAEIAKRTAEEIGNDSECVWPEDVFSCACFDADATAIHITRALEELAEKMKEMKP